MDRERAIGLLQGIADGLEAQRMERIATTIREAAACLGADDPVDHTRTTNPDGTRTPVDEPTPTVTHEVSDKPALGTCPFCCGRDIYHYEGTNRWCRDCDGEWNESDGKDTSSEHNELADYTEDSKQSIRRGLRQTEPHDLGSFAGYVTLDELDAELFPAGIVEALRHFTNQYVYEDPERSQVMVDRLITDIRELSWAMTHLDATGAAWRRWDRALNSAKAVEGRMDV